MLPLRFILVFDNYTLKFHKQSCLSDPRDSISVLTNLDLGHICCPKISDIMIPVRFLVSSLPPSYPRAYFPCFLFDVESANPSYCNSISHLSSNLILRTAVSRIQGTYFLLSVSHSRSNNDALFLQVSRHFDVYQTKPEMQAEKVQLIATAKVLGKYNTCWLH